jgi:uncharacterized protein YciI
VTGSETTEAAAIAPIRRQVIVAADPQRAFQVWTEELAAWWPFAQHSVYGAGSAAGFRNGRLVETGPDGTEQPWGTVTTWLPGQQLTMTWHPGQDAASATIVDVRFDAINERQTLVTLTHTGWENRVDASEARDDYGKGWPTVVGQFGAALERSAAAPTARDDSGIWLVLQHTAVKGDGGSIFGSPLFSEHISFLSRMQERGWLVAAGSLPDSPGSGMTILRVDAADAQAAVMAAQDDDHSVTQGLFEVLVRPWNVALTAHAIGSGTGP